MTKDELIQIIDEQKDKINELQETILRLTQIPEAVVRESELYRELQQENKNLKEDNNFYKTVSKNSETNAAKQKARLEKLRSKCARLMADNQFLAEEHDLSYWIGVREGCNSNLQVIVKDYEDMVEKYTFLEEKCASADRYTKHLENQLNEYLFENRPDEKPTPHPEKESAKSRRAGRPRKATRAQIEEARKWRKEGMSIREIARRTEDLWGSENSWSIGYVQKIVGSVKCENGKKN